ncbi:MAG: COX15/CtaA family protein [Thermoanaerobaculia bacterium]|nr:COX15/CtaA family protein [Thermoanaerobaculia bacterium]
MRRSSPLARFAWAVLGYNLLVILWGAWVRVSGSGAGCGSHWPLCDGEVIPRAPSAAKLIEFTHRATSGLALLAVVALAVWVFRARPAGHAARRAAAWTVVFMLVEAAVGAGLVLFELVADNASMARALFMAVHLANTFLLLAALARTCERLGERPVAAPLTPASRRLGRVALVLLVVAGASGAVAALGDTLFPSRTLGAALAADLSPTSHLLIRLRIGHPLLAAAAAAAVLFFVVGLLRVLAERRRAFWARSAAALVLVQVVVGLVNVALLAPAALQLLHLLLADLVWIAVVLALEPAGP